MTTVYRWWSWLVALAVVVQVGLAGYGAFYVANKVEDETVDEDKFEDGFGAHIGFGYLVVLTGLLLLTTYVFVSAAIFLVGAELDELLRKETDGRGVALPDLLLAVVRR